RRAAGRVLQSPSLKRAAWCIVVSVPIRTFWRHLAAVLVVRLISTDNRFAGYNCSIAVLSGAPSMTQQFSPIIRQLIQDKMASGRYGSEEELLVEALRSLEESDEELKAIEEGLSSVDRGEEGVTLDEAFDRLRQRHQV
ncbi:MAG TPA: type II toxin-antitoxin system ParD family antitoxin, partial [Pirellulales bacterium]